MAVPSDILSNARQLRTTQTDAENLLWLLLRNRRFCGLKFRRQRPFGRFIVDFYCHEAKLAIELDGGGHTGDEQMAYDAERTKELEGAGIKVLRFWNSDVLRNTELVLESIYAALSPSPGSTSHPLPEGEGIVKHLRQNTSAAISHSLPASLYVPVDCEIIAVTDLTPTEKLFRLQLPEGRSLGHLPGQFVEISLLGFGEAPISVASSPTRDGMFELGVRRAGSVTGALHRLGPGDRIGIRGPFGRPFDLPHLRGQDLLLISGGCGLAPLRSLIQYCEDRPEEFGRVTILYGAKSPADVLFKEELDAWETSARFACSRIVDRITEGDCYSGSVGIITSLIPPLVFDPKRTMAVLVGPPVMYRPVIAELRKKGLPSRNVAVSLERQMRCGVGKCGHCPIDHLYCCKDGPVFWLNEVEHIRGAL